MTTKRMMTYGVAAMMLMAACKKEERFNHFTGAEEETSEEEEEEEDGHQYATTESGLAPEYSRPGECASCAQWWDDPDGIAMDQLCEEAQAPAQAVEVCAMECNSAPNPTLWEECMTEICAQQVEACTGEPVTPAECVPCSAYLETPTPETLENVCAEDQADASAIDECRQGPCSTACNTHPSLCQSCMYEMCSGAIEACQS